METDLLQLLGIDDETSIKDESGLGHLFVYGLPVDAAELVPFGGDDDSFGVAACLQSRIIDRDLLLDVAQMLMRGRFLQIQPDLVFLDLRVVDVDVSLLGMEVLDESDGGRFASVARIGLESEAKDSDTLVGDGVEQSVHDALREATLLVLIHLYDLPPVRSDLGKVQAFGKIDQVEDILLEARSTETDGSFQEFRAHSTVLANGEGDLVDVGASRFADGRECIDGRDTLGEHGVGGEFGEFGRPQTDGEDPLRRNPVCIDGSKGLACILTLLCLQRTDQDAVGAEEIGDGGALGKELGVR